MKKKFVSMLLCLAMIGSLAGCSSKETQAPAQPESSGTEQTQTPEAPAEETGDAGETGEKPFEGEEISFFWVSNTSTDGVRAVCAAAEEKLGMKIEFEELAGGESGDNVIKTRLVAGDVADVVSYNCGSLLASLNPAEYFADITADFSGSLDENFVKAASVDGVLYGIPVKSSRAGAVLYNLEMYEKYNLEIPKTWDEFLANCQALKDAGETAVLGTNGDSWTSQVPYLGDHYNVAAADPNFAADFEAGITKYATSEAGLASFQKIADLVPFMNADHMATTYDDGCDLMMEDGAAHWIILTSALSNMYSLYGEDVNKLGCFALPGTDANNCGLTVWEPNAIYMNKNTEHAEAAKAFLEFYISEEGLDAYIAAELPDGPYCVKGYELPEECYTAVKQMQEDYFDTGLNALAMEFQTAVKGPNCGSICQELASGQTTPEEAAAKYDEDCKKQALQLGLEW